MVGRGSGAKRVASATWAAGLVCVLTASAADAHEIGTTKVTVRLDQATAAGPRTYAIDIVTDADALLEKLETVAGQAGPKATHRDVEARLAALTDIFLDRVSVRLDDAEVRPEVTFSVAPPTDELAPSTATIRLSAAVPPGAGRFSWSYSWTFASYALRVVGQDGAEPEIAWLEGGARSAAYTIGEGGPLRGRRSIGWQYFWLGLTHIVPHGLDHVLFVLGLFFLSTRWNSVLWQVSAFTLAHSITLGLGMFGVIGAPPAIVEPLIALSIAYVAVENLVQSELRPWRVALVFAFGLLHGMGFAGVLTELGLPPGEFVPALVSFNVGVEAGQLLVIGAAFAIVGWYRQRPLYRRLVVVPASLAITCVATYWTIERIAIWP